MVQLERELRVLDLCSGLGLVPWLLSKLGVAAKVFEVEIDPVARKVAASRAPRAVQLKLHDFWYWASEEGQKRIEGMNLDLVVYWWWGGSLARASQWQHQRAGAWRAPARCSGQ